MATYNLSIMLGTSRKSKTVLNRAFRFSETMRIVGSKGIDTVVGSTLENQKQF